MEEGLYAAIVGKGDILLECAINLLTSAIIVGGQDTCRVNAGGPNHNGTSITIKVLLRSY